jgi:hypothetical protein
LNPPSLEKQKLKKKGKNMKIDWKFKVWMGTIVIIAIGLLVVFSYQAIMNANIALVDTQNNLIIPIAEADAFFR